MNLQRPNSNEATGTANRSRSVVPMSGLCTRCTDGCRGKVLANFREIPAQCHSVAEAVIARLKEARLGGLMAMGHTGEPVCEVSVGPNRVGIILIGGMNPVAAVEEMGIETDNAAMSSVLDYSQLTSFWDL